LRQSREELREERARRTRRVDPNRPPFSSFLERDAAREQKERRRRRMLLLSLGFHVVAVVVLVFFSFWNVDELFGPSVKVTVYSAAKAPREARPAPSALESAPGAVAPAPAPAPAPVPVPARMVPLPAAKAR
jgi:hypothetical protein